MICVGCSFPELSTKNTRNNVLLCFSYGVAFSSISRMVAASAMYMNTPLQLSQVSCHFQFLALFVFCATVHTVTLYRVSQEEWTKFRESVPYVELYRYNPKHLYPKLNGYRDNGHRKVWASGVSTYCTLSVTPYSSSAHALQPDTAS